MKPGTPTLTQLFDSWAPKRDQRHPERNRAMGIVQQLQRDRRLQLGALLVVGILVYLLSPGRGGGGGGFTSEEINDLLSGANSESDIEKVPVEALDLKHPFVDETKRYEDNWRVYGDAFVDGDHLRITSEVRDQSGLIFNKNGFSDLGFQVDFSFHIHGSAKGSGLKGDGMAMFITDKPLHEGPVFGAEDRFNGLGVFIDTYRNARKGKVFPFINVMNGDGQTLYDKQNDGKANQLAGCTARNIYNSNAQARLIHTTKDGYLSLDYKIEEEWVNCFSIKDVHIPETRYLGFGASTGDLIENADIYEAQVSQLQHHGKVVQSFEEFASDEAKEEVLEKKESRYEKRRAWKKQRNEKQRAKLRSKLRNSRNRLERVIDKSGEDEGPGFLRTLWWIVKAAFMTLCALVVLYVAFTVYRVKRRSFNLKKKHTGLLD